MFGYLERSAFLQLLECSDLNGAMTRRKFVLVCLLKAFYNFRYIPATINYYQSIKSILNFRRLGRNLIRYISMTNFELTTISLRRLNFKIPVRKNVQKKVRVFKPYGAVNCANKIFANLSPANICASVKIIGHSGHDFPANIHENIYTIV